MRDYNTDVYHPKHIVGLAVADVMAKGKTRSYDELVAEVCKRVPFGKKYVEHVIGKWEDKIGADLKFQR